MTVFRTPTRQRLPKRSRTMPVHGRGDDEGRYFRCWNCGFICDSERDDHNGDTAGDDHKDYTIQAASDYRAGIGPRPVATLDVLDHYHVALKQRIPDTIVSPGAFLTFGGIQITFGGVALSFGSSSYSTMTGDSTPLTVRHAMKTNITRGCPFCGTTNWKGNR